MLGLRPCLSPYCARKRALLVAVCRNFQSHHNRAVSGKVSLQSRKHVETPFILQQAMGAWRAFNKSLWSIDSLQRRYGECYFACDSSCKGSREPDVVKLSTFLNDSSIVNGRLYTPGYIFDPTFDSDEISRQLLTDYSIPRLFSDDVMEGIPSELRPNYRWLLIGGYGTGSLLHIDPLCTSAWNALVVGRKLWILVEPGRAALSSDDDQQGDSSSSCSSSKGENDHHEVINAITISNRRQTSHKVTTQHETSSSGSSASGDVEQYFVHVLQRLPVDNRSSLLQEITNGGGSGGEGGAFNELLLYNKGKREEDGDAMIVHDGSKEYRDLEKAGYILCSSIDRVTEADTVLTLPLSHQQGSSFISDSATAAGVALMHESDTPQLPPVSVLLSPEREEDISVSISISGGNYCAVAASQHTRRRVYCFVQHPGEIVYIPRGWYHAVMNLDMTVAITHNFVPPVDTDAFLHALSLEYTEMGITEEEFHELCLSVRNYR